MFGLIIIILALHTLAWILGLCTDEALANILMLPLIMGLVVFIVWATTGFTPWEDDSDFH